MTKYDWLEFYDKQNKELNEIRSNPIVLEFGPYSCFVEDNVIRYFKYCKEVITHEIPTTDFVPFNMEVGENLNFVGCYTITNPPQNPKQSDIFYNSYTDEVYVYNNSRWSLLVVNNQYEVRGGLGNAYIETYNPVRCYTEEKTIKTVTSERWVNKEFTKKEWLDN